MTKVLLISEEDVKSKLDMKKSIEIVERVFNAHGNKEVLMPSKITLDLGEGNDWPPYGGSFNAMPAYLGEDFDAAGVKWVCGFNDNFKKGIPYINGSIILSDVRTGEQIALMDGSYITDIRTGAATGVAVKYLARKNAKVVGIIGAGVQGKMNLRAIKEVIDIEQVKIVDIREEKAKEYATEMSKELGIEVIAVKTNKEAVEGSDIIVTVTIADEPLVMNEWLKEGSLVLSVGSFQELDEQIPLTTDKLVVDSWAQNAHRGELCKLVHDGKISEENIYAELPDIVAGKKSARENDKEKICACLIGMGSTDIGIADTIYKEIKDNKEIETFNIR